LLKEKVAGPEGHFMMYELAERALDESISGKIKDHISQVCKHHNVVIALHLSVKSTDFSTVTAKAIMCQDI